MQRDMLHCILTDVSYVNEIKNNDDDLVGPFKFKRDKSYIYGSLAAVTISFLSFNILEPTDEEFYSNRILITLI